LRRQGNPAAFFLSFFYVALPAKVDCPVNIPSNCRSLKASAVLSIGPTDSVASPLENLNYFSPGHEQIAGCQRPMNIDRQ